MMKKDTDCHTADIFNTLFGACNNQDGPSYDPSIVVPHKDSGTGNAGNAQTIIPADSMQPAQPSAQAVNAQAQPAVAAGMNPHTGNRATVAILPLGLPEFTSGKNKPPPRKPSRLLPPLQNKTAPGMNPPHGDPGHRCDIAVGALLNSAPAKPVSTPVQPENKAAAASPDVAPTVPANTGSEKNRKNRTPRNHALQHCVVPLGMLMHFLRKAAKSILVISNSLFAMAMIVGAYGGWLNPSTYWFTGYFTLALLFTAHQCRLPVFLADDQAMAQPAVARNHYSVLGSRDTGASTPAERII